MTDQSGSTRFRELFDSALRAYEKETGVTLAIHQLAVKLHGTGRSNVRFAFCLDRTGYWPTRLSFLGAFTDARTRVTRTLSFHTKTVYLSVVRSLLTLLISLLVHAYGHLLKGTSRTLEV
jgi:hypothetical protein